jgi:hypothetical protein
MAEVLQEDEVTLAIEDMAVSFKLVEYNRIIMVVEVHHHHNNNSNRKISIFSRSTGRGRGRGRVSQRPNAWTQPEQVEMHRFDRIGPEVTEENPEWNNEQYNYDYYEEGQNDYYEEADAGLDW